MTAAFAEVRLENDLVLYGSVGGPQYSTDVVVVRSGHEKRNANWSQSRGRWEIGERQVDTAELQALVGFFRARQGRAQGFRWKDWADYKATRTPLEHNGVTTQGTIGICSVSSTPYHLHKIYSSGGTTNTHEIFKPIPGTVTLFEDGSEMTSGFSIDYTTGVVFFDFGVTSLDAFTWEGEFDVPVRFDTDELRSRFDAYRSEDAEALHYIFSLPVVELRFRHLNAGGSG